MSGDPTFQAIWQASDFIAEMPIRLGVQAELLFHLRDGHRGQAWADTYEQVLNLPPEPLASVLARLLRDPPDSVDVSEVLRTHLSRTTIDSQRLQVAATAAEWRPESAADELAIAIRDASSEPARVAYLICGASDHAAERISMRWLEAADSISEPSLRSIAALHLAGIRSRRVRAWALAVAGSTKQSDIQNQIFAKVEQAWWESDGPDLVAERSRRAEALHEPELRTRALLSTMHFAADSTTLRRVSGEVIDTIGQIPEPDVQIYYLEALGATVPGGPPGPWPEALELVRGIETERLRSRGLRCLFAIDNGLWGRGHLGELLTEAEALIDPLARASVLCAFGLEPPDGYNAQDWIQRLTDALEAVSEPESVIHLCGQLLLQAQSPAQLDPIRSLAADAAHRVRGPWLQVRAMESLLQMRIEPSLLALAWAATDSIKDTGLRALARAKLTQYMPRSDRHDRLVEIFEQMFSTGDANEMPRWTRMIANSASLSWWEPADD